MDHLPQNIVTNYLGSLNIAQNCQTLLSLSFIFFTWHFGGKISAQRKSVFRKFPLTKISLGDKYWRRRFPRRIDTARKHYCAVYNFNDLLILYLQGENWRISSVASLAQSFKVSHLYALVCSSNPHHGVVFEHMQCWWQECWLCVIEVSVRWCVRDNEVGLCSGIQSNRWCYLLGCRKSIVPKF